MRKLYFVIGLYLFFSCGTEREKGTSSGSLDFTVEIDTVMVDAGDEILMAGSNIFISDLSKDKKYLYNFDHKQALIEVIDLEELMLDRKIPVEREGPNGIGTYTNFMQAIGDNTFAFTSYMSSSIINLDGEKIWDFNFRNEKLSGDTLAKGENISPNYTFTNGFEEFYTQIAAHPNFSSSLAKVNTGNSTLKRIEVPQLQKLKDFNIHLEMEGGGMMTYHASIRLSPWHKGLIISNSVFNENILYFSEEDTVVLKTYRSGLTPNEKIVNFKNKVSSEEEMGSEYEKMSGQIEFGPLLWDDTSGKYYRLSHILRPKIEGEDGRKADVYLTVFDKDLNMLGEIPVKDYTKMPSYKHFAKDGTIWLHENVDDELGFIRIRVLEN